MADEFPQYDARVRGIQNFHMDDNEWNDIAYNFLVSRTGDAFEGRGMAVMSAATLGNNDHTQAICFLGADEKGRDDVTDKGRAAIAYLIDRMLKEKPSLKVKGHRDYVSTECPGDELYAFVTTGAWKLYLPKKPTIGYPKYFFNWAAWRLGEGPYKDYGPANPAVRPKYPKKPVAAVYWLALKRFLRARKNLDK
jgi:hypothetical protein